MSVPTAFVLRSFLNLLCHVLSFLWKMEKFISVTKEVFDKVHLGRLSGSSTSSLPVAQGQLTYFPYLGTDWRESVAFTAVKCI